MHPKLQEQVINFDTPDAWAAQVKGDAGVAQPNGRKPGAGAGGPCDRVGVQGHGTRTGQGSPDKGRPGGHGDAGQRHHRPLKAGGGAEGRRAGDLPVDAARLGAVGQENA